jgi:hypothetical protein
MKKNEPTRDFLDIENTRENRKRHTLVRSFLKKLTTLNGTGFERAIQDLGCETWAIVLFCKP